MASGKIPSIAPTGIETEGHHLLGITFGTINCTYGYWNPLRPHVFANTDFAHQLHLRVLKRERKIYLLLQVGFHQLHLRVLKLAAMRFSNIAWRPSIAPTGIETLFDTRKCDALVTHQLHLRVLKLNRHSKWQRSAKSINCTYGYWNSLMPRKRSLSLLPSIAPTGIETRGQRHKGILGDHHQLHLRVLKLNSRAWFSSYIIHHQLHLRVLKLNQPQIDDCYFRTINCTYGYWNK